MVTRSQQNEEEHIAPAESWLAFSVLCDRLASTRSKLTKRAAIADYLRPLNATAAGLAGQFLTGAVFPESDERKVQVGGQQIVRVLEALTSATPEQFHAAYRKYGDLGAAAEELLTGTPMRAAALSVTDVSVIFGTLATARAQAGKAALLSEALKTMSPVEAKYFIKLLLGDMRTGVKQSLVEEAIAAAAHEEVAAVRRAETMLGNIPAVVELAWRHDLGSAKFQMFHPLGFMLATPAANAEEAYARFLPEENGEPTGQLEDKYDGMRAQIQCGDPDQPGRVRIFTRTREDVTITFPELAEWFAIAPTAAVLDGEILAWDFEAGRALPFTSLQQRLGRKRVTAAMQTQTPVMYMAFDMLLSGKELLLETPLRNRRAALEAWAEQAENAAGSVPARASMPQSSLFVTETGTELSRRLSRLRLAPVQAVSSAGQLDEAFEAAQARGNEGLMLKSLSSIYEPGRRGLAWIKLKRELATLDVVVTAVEYGNGRRAAVLSDYTFAVRDGAGLKNVGKAYSGLTDAEISDLTKWFLDHTIDTRGGQLLVEPKTVIEVAFNNVMESERHDSGYSLRFPRIVRLRPDKPVDEIDTVERVAEIFRTQHKGGSS